MPSGEGVASTRKQCIRGTTVSRAIVMTQFICRSGLYPLQIPSRRWYVALKSRGLRIQRHNARCDALAGRTLSSLPIGVSPCQISTAASLQPLQQRLGLCGRLMRGLVAGRRHVEPCSVARKLTCNSLSVSRQQVVPAERIASQDHRMRQL